MFLCEMLFGKIILLNRNWDNYNKKPICFCTMLEYDILAVCFFYHLLIQKNILIQCYVFVLVDIFIYIELGPSIV